jgi:hypothetical protein
VAARFIGRRDKIGLPALGFLSPIALPPPGPPPCPLVYNRAMANLTLVYGLRLLPSEEISEVGDAIIQLKNGREARVTMHVLEGGKEEIEKQLKNSLSAFFDFYPEI